jgi:NADPH:quinone reductase-like Zn-dependent oxidoreductase
MLCRNGGIVGVKSNGRFAEYAAVPSKNVFKISEDISWEMAASIPVSALTVYHALMQSKARFNEFIVIIGASGNIGLFAVQFEI